MPRPTRATTPSRRAAATAESLAIGRLHGLLVERHVPRSDEPAVAALDQTPEKTPVARPVGPRVPARDTPERCPQAEDAAVLRQQAVGERGRLTEVPPVLRLRPHRADHREQLLVASGVGAAERLLAPEEEAHVTALVVEVFDVLRLVPVGWPGNEARRDAVAIAAPVDGPQAPDAV